MLKLSETPLAKRRSSILKPSVEATKWSIESLEDSVANAQIPDQKFISFDIIPDIELSSNMLVLLLLVAIGNYKVIGNLRPLGADGALVLLVISVEVGAKEGEAVGG